jgi:hypothetical protein
MATTKEKVGKLIEEIKNVGDISIINLVECLI